ncbi:MAG: helix-turn-helix transcriptional regulator [Methylotenera sp.]|nr:helix-turn-helix transcriptional regulator [Oligoflexia bacterium]
MNRAEPFYIERIRDELLARKQKNSSYSLRAFARDLEIDPSAISRILKGKQTLSLLICLKVIRKLKLSEDESCRFLNAVADHQREQFFMDADRQLRLMPDVSMTMDSGVSMRQPTVEQHAYYGT